MGCDIHAFVEVKEHENSKQWWSFGGRQGYRDYRVFEAMAGVRGEDKNAVVPPRGMPKDIGYKAIMEYTLFITDSPEKDESCIDSQTAKKWVEDGSSEEWYGHRITGPDWHSASWLSAAEMQQVAERVPTPWTKAISAMMNSLSESYPLGCRIVFYFDN